MFEKLLFSIICIIISFCSFAQPEGFIKVADTIYIKQKLMEVSSKTTSINAGFIQEKNLTFLYEKIISKGTLMYKNPEKLRLEYTEPFSYLLIMNNGKLMIKTDNSETKLDLESSRMFNEINNLIINSIQGKIVDSQDLETSFFENDNSFFVKMIPRQEELTKYVKTIELLISKEDYTVTEFKVIEQSDDYTLIKFINKKLNEEIPDDSFSID